MLATLICTILYITKVVFGHHVGERGFKALAKGKNRPNRISLGSGQQRVALPTHSNRSSGLGAPRIGCVRCHGYTFVDVINYENESEPSISLCRKRE